ncbi:MAG TPA: DegT/DnrJ/EryC1/StrS family aminotransferase [Spirochaetota bacterium]|nr:DegT/DnrJ/EryC1/StrS family aminotransferase [Spirochaetota bacterium]
MKIVSSKPTITRKDLEGVLDCMIHDELNTGSPVKTFESAVSDITTLKYPLAVNSLVSAYILIFRALDISPEDEVIIPSFYSAAPLSAMKLTGGKPVIVDSSQSSVFPSVEQIKEKITEKTKAVILSDSCGFHAETEGLQDAGVPVIVDISHSIGTEVNEKPAGSYAAFAVASFAPSMIITTGNGGIVLTSNSKYFSVMREMRSGTDDTPGFDFTMTDLQGAMGISQVMKLKDFIRRRREIALKYYESLRITTHKPVFPYSDSFAYQSFPVLFDSPADRLDKYWKKNGIELERTVPVPLHALLGLKGFDYPNADRLSKKLFSLPLYPTLTKKEIDKIAKSLAAFI